MTDAKRRPDAEAEYGTHLQRSETVWNRWSGWYRLSERDFEPMRTELLTQLCLEEGDRVLEIGCGPGVNFGAVREAVGADGRLVAIDYSPAMVEKATARVEEHGWENVDVVRADATTADLGGPYDAALATLALSVLPDVERAVRNVRSALGPRAPLGVLDIRPFPGGPLRACNPLLERFLRWYANWNPDGNVRGTVDDVFGGFEPLDTYLLGTIYTLKARRLPSGAAGEDG